MSESDTNDSETFNSSAAGCRQTGRGWIAGVAMDMDGLLFDTERLYWDVGNTLLQRRGYQYSRELQQRMMGRVGVASVQQMIEFHDLADAPESLLAESDQLYAELLANDIQPMQGLDRWIGFLGQAGIPFGLATSSNRKFVNIIFESVEWQSQLSFVLTGDDVTRGKPDPEMYLKAAERLGIDPERMLVLEDSGNGCAAAVAAGAYTVAIPSEHTRGQDFTGAKLIAESLLDPRLWELLK